MYIVMNNTENPFQACSRVTYSALLLLRAVATDQVHLIASHPCGLSVHRFSTGGHRFVTPGQLPPQWRATSIRGVEIKKLGFEER